MKTIRILCIALLLVSFSIVLMGCETAQEKVQATDDWIKENMW